MFCYLSSYFASISINKNFHDPRTILSGRKVCVGGGGWFEGKFSVSFGPKPRFRLWIWTWTNLNKIISIVMDTRRAHREIIKNVL